MYYRRRYKVMVPWHMGDADEAFSSYAEARDYARRYLERNLEVHTFYLVEVGIWRLSLTYCKQL